MKKIEKICINCPAGCHLELLCQKDGSFAVTGNSCPRGAAYAKQELTDPRRVVTAAVPLKAPVQGCVPVKTTAPLPAALIPELMHALLALRVTLPVRRGEILLKNFRDTNIDIVFTRSIS